MLDAEKLLNTVREGIGTLQQERVSHIKVIALAVEWLLVATCIMNI